MALPPLGPGPIDVVGFGENSVDLLATVPHWPAPDDKLELINLLTMPGGQVASAMVACARLGCATRYLGVFGNDENGNRIERALRGEGIDTSGCLRASVPNRSALIIVDRVAGTRSVLWRRDQALDWPASRMTAELVSNARVFLVDATDVDASVAAAKHARTAGVPVMADVDGDVPGIEGLLRQVDILVTPGDFALSHTGETSLSLALRSIRNEYQTAAVVATLGADGAVAWDGKREVASPGFNLPLVDPTGAGDAFRGGFIAAWTSAASDTPLEDILTFANATAALNCRAVGAQAGLPTRAEVTALVTEPGVRRSNGHGSSSSGG